MVNEVLLSLEAGTPIVWWSLDGSFGCDPVVPDAAVDDRLGSEREIRERLPFL